MSNLTLSGKEPLDVVDRVAGIGPAHPLWAVRRQRAEFAHYTEASHVAVLHPQNDHGLSAAERAALASRMACANAVDELALHYQNLLTQTSADATLAAIAAGQTPNALDRRLSAILRHVDLVTSSPRDARRDDIEALVAAGLSTPEIVAFSELVAFVNYQIRVVAGLLLLSGGGE